MAIHYGARIASTRHTLVLTAILLLIAAAGYLSLQRAGAGTGSGGPGPLLYLGLIAAELGLLYYVRTGIHAKALALADLVGERSWSVRRLVNDIALGLLLLGVLLGLEWLLNRLLGVGDPRLVRQLVVHRLADVPLWLLLSATAGVVEEITFRGYFQRQFGAWLRSPWAGVAAQAVLFGVTHGYQGPTLIVHITLLGIAFGVTAHLRRSLVPGIVAHIALDVIGGLSGLI